MAPNRSRALNRRMDDLFPVPERCTFTCWDCGWNTAIRWDPLAVLLHESCPECGADLGRENVHRVDEGLCRLYGEETPGQRTRWCSERCLSIANAVQRMFTWTSVRERILDRDGRACQNPECGASGEGVELHVDHIHPVSEGGHPFDERNLITLCSHCHHMKTHQGESVTSEDASGLGLGAYLETESGGVPDGV